MIVHATAVTDSEKQVANANTSDVLLISATVPAIDSRSLLLDEYAMQRSPDDV